MAVVRKAPLMGWKANRRRHQAVLEAARQETLAVIPTATAEVRLGVALRVRHPQCFLSLQFPR